MSRIVLCTSSSGLYELPTPHHVHMIPLNIKINNVNFVDGKNINSANLNRLMLQSPNAIAKTSPASEQDVFSLFAQLYQHGYREFFVVCISSQFSQSLAILKKVKESFAHQMKIYLYDSKSLNIHEGALAFEADILLQQGRSFVEIANHLDNLRRNSVFYFTLYDLHYIIRSKKLSAPAGFLANLFDIRPIMEINQAGQIVPKEKVRKIDNALTYLGNAINRYIANHDSFVYVLQGGIPSDTEYFLDLLEERCGLTNLPIFPATCISLANHGPRGVAIGAFREHIPQIAYKI